MYRAARPVPCLFLALIVTLCSTCSSRCLAESDLTSALAKVSASVVEVMVTNERESLALGAVNGPPGVTSGAEILSILKSQLEEQSFQNQRVRLRATAPTTLRGTFELESLPESPGGAIRMEFQLVDSRGKTLVTFNSLAVQRGQIQVVVDAERDILKLTQVSVALPPDVSPKERLQKITESLDRKSEPPFAEDGFVFAQKGREEIGRYGVAILVNGEPLPPRIEDGLAIVEIPRGTTYEIRLLNDTPFEAAADVRIDGLSTFEFSELRNGKEGPQKGRPLYNNWILTAASQATVPGWHRRDVGPDNISTFVVTRYADSAAATLDQKQSLGTVQVTFSAAWPAGQDPPDALKEPSRTRGLPDSTALGQAKTANVVAVAREIGIARSSVTIRYSRPTED